MWTCVVGGCGAGASTKGVGPYERLPAWLHINPPINTAGTRLGGGISTVSNPLPGELPSCRLWFLSSTPHPSKELVDVLNQVSYNWSPNLQAVGSPGTRLETVETIWSHGEEDVCPSTPDEWKTC